MTRGRAAYESETYFLQAALRLAAAGERYARTPFETRTIDLAAGASLPDLEKTEAVVLANVANLRGRHADRLGEFVEGGGGLLVFTGDRVEPEGTRELTAAGLGVGTFSGLPLPPSCPGGLNDGMSGTQSSSHLTTQSTATCAGRCSRRSRVSKPIRRPGCWRGSGVVNPHFWSGPRAGKILWFTSACDRGWGDWPARDGCTCR